MNNYSEHMGTFLLTKNRICRISTKPSMSGKARRLELRLQIVLCSRKPPRMTSITPRGWHSFLTIRCQMFWWIAPEELWSLLDHTEKECFASDLSTGGWAGDAPGQRVKYQAKYQPLARHALSNICKTFYLRRSDAIRRFVCPSVSSPVHPATHKHFFFGGGDYIQDGLTF